MGISVRSVKKLNCVRIISRADDAIDHEASNWDLYDENPVENEGALKFLPDMQPTVFICNFELDAKDGSKIQDAMFAGIDEDRQPKPAMGAWMLAVVKHTLKGIENPTGFEHGIKFRSDSRGYASDETLNLLQKTGILSEIFNHWVRLSNTGVNREAKKS